MLIDPRLAVDLPRGFPPFVVRRRLVFLWIANAIRARPSTRCLSLPSSTPSSWNLRCIFASTTTWFCLHNRQATTPRWLVGTSVVPIRGAWLICLRVMHMGGLNRCATDVSTMAMTTDAARAAASSGPMAERGGSLCVIQPGA